MNREFVGQLVSEAMAMFIIIAFGDSVAAMYFLYTPSPYQQAYWGVCIAWVSRSRWRFIPPDLSAGAMPTLR